MIPKDLQIQVKRALEEDVGSGDLTASLVPDVPARAAIRARERAVLCGIPWCEGVFDRLGEVRITWHKEEGAWMEPGDTLCILEGPARAILTGERTALNFLQTLSGTATRSRLYKEAVEGLPVEVLDTRKTLPGLRSAQKYAVAVGGCRNHRLGLFDAILIKENHLRLMDIPTAVREARKRYPGVPVEVEVENLEELERALEGEADTVLLDNFSLEELRKAVSLTQGRARLEASGGITLETIRQVAETGVDAISVGSLTKDLRAADLSLRLL